jgi:hypothetical protein
MPQKGHHLLVDKHKGRHHKKNNITSPPQKLKQKTRKTTIKNFFAASRNRESNSRQVLTETDNTDSLRYSSTSDSSTDSTTLRPAITIRKNSEVCKQGDRFTQLKLKSQIETNLPFGDDIHEQTDDQTIIFFTTKME